MTENNSEQNRGYGNPQYGSQSQPPSYAQYMGYNNPTAPVEEPTLPAPVKYAVYCMYGIVALSIISSLVTVIFPQQLVGSFGDTYSSVIDDDSSMVDGEFFMSAASILTLIFNLIFCAAYVTFAIFAWRGANWARIVMTVIFALSVFGLFQIFTVVITGFNVPALLSFISGLLAVAGIVLLWQTSSNTYYRSMKTYRQWQTQSAQYR